MELPKAEVAMRDRLFEAAINLFARKGYHATSVREIVAAAGVTKPVLYYWFRNKEGMFRHLMDEAVSRHRAVLAEVQATGGPASERILLLAERVMGLVAENREIVRVLDSVRYGPREGAPAVDFETLHGEFDTCLRGLVSEAIASGEFRDGDVEAMHLALLGGFLICKALLCEPPPAGGPGREVAPDYVQRLMSLAMQPDYVRRIMRVAMDGMWAARPASGGERR
jgi:AcrR family transcriptional regulator